MSNRSVAAMQIAVNVVLIILISAVLFCVPIVIVTASLVGNSDGVTWPLLFEQYSDIYAFWAVVSILIGIFNLFVSKKYAEEIVPGWANLISGIIPGMILRFAWRGFKNAQLVHAEEARVNINRKWLLISSLTGCIAIIGIPSMIILGDDRLLLPFLSDSDVPILLGTIAAAVFFFYGVNRAFRFLPCKQCGQQITDDASFCAQCGNETTHGFLRKARQHGGHE
ncbi:MAG: zinc ribbon domain-containing protein [Candidatus Acidiferrales bacterium]